MVWCENEDVNLFKRLSEKTKVTPKISVEDDEEMMKSKFFRNLGRTFVDICLLFGGICILICFKFWTKQKIFFVIVAPFILLDIFFTWVPHRALSKWYRKQITDVLICIREMENDDITKEVCLTSEETALLRALCEKFRIDFPDEDKSLTGIEFKFPLDEYCLCLYQSRKLPAYYFVEWAHMESTFSDAIVLEQQEQEKIERIITTYK